MNKGRPEDYLFGLVDKRSGAGTEESPYEVFPEADLPQLAYWVAQTYESIWSRMNALPKDRIQASLSLESSQIWLKINGVVVYYDNIRHAFGPDNEALAVKLTRFLPRRSD